MQQTPDHIYYVCDSFRNDKPRHEFDSIQEAIDQVQEYEKVKILVMSDFLDIPALIMRCAGTNITIDGGNQWEVTFLGSMIATIRKEQTLKFRSFAHIQGREIRLAEKGASFGVYDTQSMVAFLNLVPDNSRTSICIYTSNFYGCTDRPVITVENKETKMEVFNSFIKGGAGRPAILFNVEANRKLKIKNSVVLHGSTGAPIQVRAGLFVDVYIYNCFGKEKIVNNPLNNLIVINNNNISDGNILF